MRQICANFLKPNLRKYPANFGRPLNAQSFLRRQICVKQGILRAAPCRRYIFARASKKHCLAKKLGKYRAKTQNFCRQKIKITFSKNLLA